MDLVEGFAFRVLGKRVSASWVGSGQCCSRVELRVIGSVGYGCLSLSLSLLFRVVIKWIWWRALGLSLDCWINESMRLESGRVGIGPLGRAVNRISVQNKMGLNFEEMKDQFEVFMNPCTLPVCTWIELFLFSLWIRIFSYLLLLIFFFSCNWFELDKIFVCI